jgi:uncharacterized HAD superfamily protein
MQKPVLGCDFDDVIMDFNGAFIPFHNRQYGTRVTYEGHHTYSLEEVYGCDAHTIIGRVHKFCDSLEHLETAPVPGAITGLRILAQYFAIHIITSRSESTRDVTGSWLRKNVPADIITDVHFTNSFGHNPKLLRRSKAEVCISLGARGLIDDAAEHAKAVSTHGIAVALPDRPWNREELPPRVVRTHSWDETVAWAIRLRHVA